MKGEGGGGGSNKLGVLGWRGCKEVAHGWRGVTKKAKENFIKGLRTCKTNSATTRF